MAFDPKHFYDGIQSSFVHERELGRKEEREWIVYWLRKEADELNAWDSEGYAGDVIKGFANSIEQGEHLK